MGTIEGREPLIDRMDYDYLQVEIINFFDILKPYQSVIKVVSMQFAWWWQIIANPSMLTIEQEQLRWEAINYAYLTTLTQVLYL